MPYLKWNSALAMGKLELDEQHKILFNICNDLIAAIDKGEGEASLKDTFTRLKMYAETHFAAEEEYMKEIGYPELESHAAEHAQLLVRTNSLWKLVKDGKTISSHSVSRFIVDWIIDHMMDSDKAVGEFARN